MFNREILEGILLIGLAFLIALFLKRGATRQARRALFEELLADYSRVGSIAGEPDLQEKIESYRRRYNRA